MIKWSCAVVVAARTYIFAAANHHSESCGIPPQVRTRAEPGHYYGYFQNEHGEQWVLDIDVSARRGILRGGDNDWESEIEVASAGVQGVVLNRAEQLWLQACLAAAFGSDRDR
jgi:hypothetical protein